MSYQFPYHYPITSSGTQPSYLLPLHSLPSYTESLQLLNHRRIAMSVSKHLYQRTALSNHAARASTLLNPLHPSPLFQFFIHPTIHSSSSSGCLSLSRSTTSPSCRNLSSFPRAPGTAMTRVAANRTDMTTKAKIHCNATILIPSWCTASADLARS